MNVINEEKEEECFSKGEFVFKEGNWGNRVYEIQSGEILIYKDGHTGNLVPLGTLGPGEMFGEMFLFSHDHRRNATAVAISEVVVTFYPQSLIVEDIESMNPRQKKLVKAMNNKILRITEHYVQQVTEILHEESVKAQDNSSEQAKKGESKIKPKLQNFKAKVTQNINKKAPKKHQEKAQEKPRAEIKEVKKNETKVRVSHDRVSRSLD